jgi:hypothetical protein
VLVDYVLSKRNLPMTLLTQYPEQPIMIEPIMGLPKELKSTKVGLKDFEFIRCIGSGGFSKVLIALLRVGIFGTRTQHGAVLRNETHREVVALLVEQTLHHPERAHNHELHHTPLHRQDAVCLRVANLLGLCSRVLLRRGALLPAAKGSCYVASLVDKENA